MIKKYFYLSNDQSADFGINKFDSCVEIFIFIDYFIPLFSCLKSCCNWYPFYLSRLEFSEVMALQRSHYGPAYNSCTRRLFQQMCCPRQWFSIKSGFNHFDCGTCCEQQKHACRHQTSLYIWKIRTIVFIYWRNKLFIKRVYEMFYFSSYLWNVCHRSIVKVDSSIDRCTVNKSSIVLSNFYPPSRWQNVRVAIK